MRQTSTHFLLFCYFLLAPIILLKANTFVPQTFVTVGVVNNEDISFDVASTCPDHDGNVQVTVIPSNHDHDYQVSLDGGVTFNEFGVFEFQINLFSNNITDLAIQIRGADGCVSRIKEIVLPKAITFTAAVSCPNEDGRVAIFVHTNLEDAIVLVNDSVIDGLEFTVPAGSSPTIVVQNEGCASAPVFIETTAAIALELDLACPEYDPFNQTNSTDALVTLSGGNAPYTVFINGQPAGQTNEQLRLEGLAPNDYIISATDAYGCSFFDQVFTVRDLLTLTLNKDSSNLLVCGEGKNKVVVDSMDDIISYSWSFSPVGDNLIPNAGNTHTYITDEAFGTRVIYVLGTTLEGCQTAPLPITLSHYEAFTVIAAEPICDSTTNTYTVTFYLAGGNDLNSPYYVDGMPIEGEVWTSPPIPSGQSYFFEFDDARNDTIANSSCHPVIAQGNFSCMVLAAVADTFTIEQGETLTFNVLDNDTGDGIRVTAVTDPANGTLQWQADGMMIYQPNIGFIGTEIIVYEITDIQGERATATIVILVEDDTTMDISHNMDCDNVLFTGHYIVTVVIADGIAPYSISGNVEETGVLNNDPVSFTVPCDEGYIVTIVDAIGDSVTVDERNTVRCCPGSIAITLMNYTVEWTATGNNISWQTASEIDNDFFILEYAQNGYDFVPIAQLEGQGTTSQTTTYQYLHQPPPSGTHYYQLKAVDWAGVEEHLGIVSIQQENNSLNNLQIYPNPTTNTTTIELVSSIAQTVPLLVYDDNGQIVAKRMANITVGKNEIPLDLTNYADGIYMIIIDNGGSLTTTKIVKMD